MEPNTTPPEPAPRVPATVAAFLARAASAPAAPPKRKMWGGARGKKGLGPRGKVPAGIRGLTRKTAGKLHSERAAEWESAGGPDRASWIQRSPAWAVSAAVHLLAAVVMMNVVYFARNERIGQVFRMTLRASAPGGAGLGDQDTGMSGDQNDENAPAGAPDPDRPALPALPDSSSRLPVLERGAGPGLPMRVVGSDGSGENGLGGLYAGRGGSGRGTALRKYGGDEASEQAVEDGLDWLARHQSADGSWEIAGFTKMCPKDDACGVGLEDAWGRYFSGYRAAITGLATLAFLGAGYSHMDDHARGAETGAPVAHRYTAVVDRALQYLAKIQRPDGLVISGNQEYERSMYSHGMAGLALIEAYSMTHDPRLRPHAQLAVNAIVAAQGPLGGWDYSPQHNYRSDTSVTSWQILALRSARAAELAVPKKAWDRARAYLKAVTDEKEGTIGYELEGRNALLGAGCNAMVAAGWVTRTYLGMADDHPLQDKFAQALLKVPPRYDSTWGACQHWSILANNTASGHWSLYYTYNATLALFHHGGEAWTRWNRMMRACTLPAQNRDGHERGSWDPVTSDASMGGRVYATAMNVMNLEIYYRFLPVYEVGAEYSLAPLLEAADWAQIVDNSAKGTFHVRRRALPADPAEGEAGAGGEASVAALAEQLRSSDMMTRRNAARELCQRREKSAVPQLLEAIRAENTSLKPVLIEYLADFCDVDAAAEFLIELLDSETLRLKGAAHTALKKGTGQAMGPYRGEWAAWLKGRGGAR